MNKIILLGNLTKDPEIKATQTGKKIASFSLAVNDGKDPNGNDLVQYFNLTAWEKKAEVIEKYVKKGHKLLITGKLQNRTWDKPDGTKAYATDILVLEMEMLTSKAESERIETSTLAGSTQSTKSMDNDLPKIDINSLNIHMPF